MNKIVKYIALLIALTGVACKADQIGYLDIKNANYSEKVVTFKATLDPDDPDDARMIEFHIPQQTTALQGVDASSAPIYTIEQIDSENGDSTAALAQFSINSGDGSISLLWNHTVPPGEYIFSIGISNEDGANFEIAASIIIIMIE